MISTTVIYYLIAVNAFGLVLSLINILICKRAGHAHTGLALVVIALLGGALGILMPILLLDAKPSKENMMNRLLIVCILVLEAIALLVLTGHHNQTINLNVFRFLADHKPFLFYLCIINIVSFILFGIDKLRAVREKSRIRIVTLLLVCALGGSIGGLAGMYLFRHKTRTNYFTLGVPLIILVQIFVLIFVMNAAF